MLLFYWHKIKAFQKTFSDSSIKVQYLLIDGSAAEDIIYAAV